MKKLKIEMLSRHYNETKQFSEFSEESISLWDIRSLGSWEDILNVESSFFKELELFAQRNLVHNKNKIDGGRICMRCFKSFLIKLSREYGLNEIDLKVLIFSLGKGHIGHNGYYMDGENVNIIDCTDR